MQPAGAPPTSLPRSDCKELTWKVTQETRGCRGRQRMTASTGAGCGMCSCREGRGSTEGVKFTCRCCCDSFTEVSAVGWHSDRHSPWAGPEMKFITHKAQRAEGSGLTGQGEQEGSRVHVHSASGSGARDKMSKPVPGSLRLASWVSLKEP